MIRHLHIALCPPPKVKSTSVTIYLTPLNPLTLYYTLFLLEPKGKGTKDKNK